MQEWGPGFGQKRGSVPQTKEDFQKVYYVNIVDNF